MILGTAEEFLEVVDVLHGSPYVIQTFDPDQRELMEKVPESAVNQTGKGLGNPRGLGFYWGPIS